MEKRTMQKTATIMALVTLFTLVAAGVAVAVTQTCTTVPCTGTSADDVLKERVGDGENDVIYGLRGNDRLRAGRYTNDTDELHGGRGKDRLNVFDGDPNDRADGGPGKHDFCFVDDFSEASGSCEVIAIV